MCFLYFLTDDIKQHIAKVHKYKWLGPLYKIKGEALLFAMTRSFFDLLYFKTPGLDVKSLSFYWFLNFLNTTENKTFTAHL